MEKGYRHWGHDISAEDTPLEAGLGFAVAWDKPGGFIGRDALAAAARGAACARRLVQFALADAEPLLYHDEPIWRDGAHRRRASPPACTATRSAPPSASATCPHGARAMAELHPPRDAGAIEIAGERFAAEGSLRPFYDPKRQRVRM